MAAIDFSKTLKDLYTARKKVAEVRAGPGAFFAVDGKGEPGGEAFQQAIQKLFTAVYTVKFALKFQGGVDFKVNRLECLYFSDPAKTPRSEWRWRFLVRVPDEVTAKDLSKAWKEVRKRRGLDVSDVRRIRWKEGRAFQVLHVGPYEKLCEAYGALAKHIRALGRESPGPAHEIYLSDPRRTAPEKLKTIIRLPVN